jgi:hypothetical protein
MGDEADKKKYVPDPALKTTFKGKIGITLTIVHDDGNRQTKMYDVDLAPRYFGNLGAQHDPSGDWWVKGDFKLMDSDKNPFAPKQNVNIHGSMNVIDDEEVLKKMRFYVRQQMFNLSNRITYYTRDTSPPRDNPYFYYAPVQGHNHFYVYVGSPAHNWIEGMYNPPYDHNAPAEFGVQFTLIRKLRPNVFQGGNPNVEFNVQMFSSASNNFIDTFTTDTIKFGGDLLTSDFGFRNKDYILARPKLERGYGLPSEDQSLYFYEGQRKDEFFEFVKQRVETKYNKAFIVERASPDGEFFVYPDTLIENWLIDGDDTEFAPNMALSVKVMLRTATEEEKKEEDEDDDDEVDLPKADYRYQEPSTATGRFEGTGKIEIEGQDQANAYVEKKLSEFYALDFTELDKRRGAYKIRDKDGDGDFKEAQDLFGTKQGESKDMIHQTSYDFQEGAPPDLYRPFDEYDNEYRKTEKQIEDSTIVSKKELQEFNEYASMEAYMSDAEFDNKTSGIPYTDNRKESYLVAFNNAEARIYEWYDEYHKEQRLVIAFRGTQNPTNSNKVSDALQALRDVLTDLDSKTHPLTYIGIRTDNIDARGIVHQGFADYVNNLYEKLVDIIRTFKGFYTKGKVFVCGHSLGGAAALIFSYMTFMRENIVPDRIYQFGAPMGIWTFGDHINKNLPVINVFHQYDIIPPVSALFKHHGTKLIFDGDGNLAAYPANVEVPGYDLAGADNPMGESARLLAALKLNSAFEEGSDTSSQIDAIEQIKQGITDRSVLKVAYYGAVAIGDFYSGFSRGLEGIGGNLMIAIQRQAIAQSLEKFKLNTDFFYHTAYRRIIDEWKNKSIKIDKFRYFDKLFKHDPNPRGHFHDHPYTYHSSIDGTHMYMDANGNFYMGVDTPSSLAFHPLNNTEPLGLIFYDKNKNDLANKSIVFYS